MGKKKLRKCEAHKGGCLGHEKRITDIRGQHRILIPDMMSRYRQDQESGSGSVPVDQSFVQSSGARGRPGIEGL